MRKAEQQPSRETELLEHECLVPLLPALAHLAVLDVIDDEPVDCHGLPGRWRRAERSGVRAHGVPPERHAVSLNELLLDAELDVGQSREQSSHQLLPRTQSAKWSGDAGNVNHAVGREDGVRRRHGAAIESGDPDAGVLQQ